MAELIKTGGAAFDPGEDRLYFLASKHHHLEVASVAGYPCLLVAVNELTAPKAQDTLEGWLDRGCKVLLDSGIYNLAMEHAKRHALSHDVALNMAPDEVDGFDALMELYVDLVRRYGDRLWGYIELDLGGKDRKRVTRGKLEAIGLRPIPVYHPFGDGWDYFDELASRYDRICLGNIVRAMPPVRTRLLATLHERKQAYRDLWIHALGMTPSTIINAYPMDSCDSSSWVVGLRWSASHHDFAACAPVGRMPSGFRYVRGEATGFDSDTSYRAAVRLATYQYQHLLENWKAHLHALRSHGCHFV